LRGRAAMACDVESLAFAFVTHRGPRALEA
jgi:hypothetical protein